MDDHRRSRGEEVASFRRDFPDIAIVIKICSYDISHNHMAVLRGKKTHSRLGSNKIRKATDMICELRGSAY